MNKPTMLEVMEKSLSLTPCRNPEEEAHIRSTYTGKEYFTQIMAYMRRCDALDTAQSDRDFQEDFERKYGVDPYELSDYEKTELAETNWKRLTEALK